MNNAWHRAPHLGMLEIDVQVQVQMQMQIHSREGSESRRYARRVFVKDKAL
jgi:hypothetical protein